MDYRLNVTGASSTPILFTVSAGQQVIVDAEGAATGRGTLVDPYLEIRYAIWDPINSVFVPGNLYSQNDNGGIGLNSTINIIYDNQSYFAYVRAADNISSGTVTLRINNDDFGNSAESPFQYIAPPYSGPVSATINYGGDRDAINVYLIAGLSYTLEARGASSGNGTLADPYLELRDSSDRVLAFDDDSGVGTDSLLTYTPTVDGEYYAVARAFGPSDIGTYQFNFGIGHGTAGNDVIYGDYQHGDGIDGGAGDDFIDGSLLSDTLFGGGGNDTLKGGAEAIVFQDARDLLYGGTGNDTYIVENGDLFYENPNEGTDTVYCPVDFVLPVNFENAVLTDSAGSVTGNALGNRLTGTVNGNMLSGLDGNDMLIGDGGADNMFGGNGNDTLDGGAGIDALRGNAGSDLYIVTNGDLFYENPNEGTDTVRCPVSFTLPVNFENVLLTGIGAINAFGNTAANQITGNSAANLLDGGGGADTLVGAGGADTLTGGTGADVFRFFSELESTPAVRDILRGGVAVAFEAPGAGTGDLIDLGAVDANTGLSGDQAFAFGSIAAGGLSLTETGTATLVQGNTDADAAFEFALLIEDGATRATAYSAADFVL